MTRQAGRGCPLKEVASELGCSWYLVTASVRRWGEALLDADVERIAQTEALGLDEHLMWRRGRYWYGAVIRTTKRLRNIGATSESLV